MPSHLQPATLARIQLASQRLQRIALRTPLLRLNADSSHEIYLKLENLQAIGSFKLRPSANIILNLTEAEKAKGIFTASSGNAGIGAAWFARSSGLEIDIVIPDNAPLRKRHILKQLGARLHIVPFAEWWQVISTHHFPGLDRVFIDAVGCMPAIEGNGMLGLEIMEQLPDVDTIFVPFGGGGLVSGVASAARAINPDVTIVACETEAAQPLTAAFAHGEPVRTSCKPGFISGMGVETVLPWMWPLLTQLVDRTVVVSLAQVVDSIRLLAERSRIVAEGAGAVSVAAALAERTNTGKTVCIVSGGNIDPGDFCNILAGVDLVPGA